MNKLSVLLVVFFIGFLFISNPKNILASCYPEDPVDGCTIGISGVSCGDGNCCEKPDECNSSSSSGPGGGRQILKGDCLDTAIGCIPIGNEGSFFGYILGWAIGIGGGVAFLLIILATFQIMTSQGDPKRLQAGQELLYSAIMGLILLVLSVFVLRIIGVDLFGFL